YRNRWTQNCRKRKIPEGRMAGVRDMRTAIGKELRKLFAAELARRQPNFVRVQRPKPHMDPKWIFQIASDLIFFIELGPLPREDSFVIEIGWTDKGEIGVRENYQSRVNTNARRWGTRLSTLQDEEGNNINKNVWD